MKNYEIMYIVNANLDDATRTSVIEKVHSLVTDNGGQLLEVNEWGLRELAYPINDEVKGHYVVVKVALDDDALKEFNRVVKLNKNVLRFLVVAEKQK